MIKPKLLQTVVGLLGLVAWLPATAVFIESLPPSALAGLSGAANDLANGNVAAAEAKFRGVLEQDPESWAAMLGLADVAYRREDTQAVADYLRRALEAAPDNAAVQTAWGRYEYLGGEFRSAEHAFLEAARLDPELADPHGELGALYAARLGEPDKAIHHYRLAAELAPDIPDYRYALSSMLSQQGRLDEALEVIASTRRLEPDAAYPLQLEASLLASHGRIDEALAALDTARGIEPDNAQVQWARGELFMQMGDYDEAREAYRAMLELAPRAFAAHTRLGLSYQLAGDFRNAERAYRQALAIEPGDALALNNLAYGALDEPGRQREALRWAEQAVALQPSNPEFLDTLGSAQAANGLSDDALATFARAVELAPGYAPAHYHFGLALEKAGRPAEARQHYSIAARGAGKEAELSRARLSGLD